MKKESKKETGAPLKNRAAEAVFELLLLLVMLYAVLACAALFFVLPFDGTVVCALGAVFGVIYAAGAILERRRLALGVLVGAMLLSVIVLSRFSLLAEALAASAGYLSVLLLRRFPWPRRIFVLLAVGVSVAGFAMGRALPALLVAALLFLALSELISLYGDIFAVQLAPLLAVLLLAVLALPASETPFDWSFVLRIGDSVASMVRSAAEEISYYFSAPESTSGLLFGYGGNGVEGGALSGGDKEELYVSNRTRGDLYIKGQEYGLLEGDRWQPAAGSKLADGLWYTDFLTVLEKNDIPKRQSHTFAEVRRFECTYGFLKTRDVLRPANLLYLESTAREQMTENPGDFTYRDVQQRDFRYDVSFLDLDYANPDLIELMKHPETDGPAPSYAELAALSQSYFGVALESVVSETDYNSLLALREEAESSGSADPLLADRLDAYLAVSDVTARTRALAVSLTEGLETDYEKAKAIELYLRQYRYDTETDLRESENFIDAFLFDAQSGYCFHYASAMVMLLRLNGIPARLVEGYCCTFPGQPERNRYPIMGSESHLWPEAYLAGFGWVRFEPTSAIPSAEVLGWGLRYNKDGAENEAAEETEKPVPTPPAAHRPAEEAPSAAELAAEAEAARAAAERRAALLRLLLLVLMGGLLLFAALALCERKLPYRFRGEAARLRAWLDDLCWLIRKMHPGDWKNRPLLDYAAALETPALRDGAEAAFLAYYRMRYCGEALTAKEWDAIRAARLEIYRNYLDTFDRKRRYRLLAFLSCHAGFRPAQK